jgi:hypothetical protein
LNVSTDSNGVSGTAAEFYGSKKGSGDDDAAHRASANSLR